MTANPVITARDRLGLTLFLAVSFHALVILGVSFNLEDEVNDNKQPLPTMEVTLVHNQDDTAPDTAQLLAQANQRGGGSEESQRRPGSPMNNPLPLPEESQDSMSEMESAPQVAARPLERRVMTVTLAERAWYSPEEEPRVQPLERELDANVIHERKLELASISAEIRQLREEFAQAPREKYISANTREYKYASYFDAWRAKVERIGNLNYPDEAKRGRISGELLLDVAIHADGSLKDIAVLRSSGHTVLDDAAKRIVRMAAPYAPFSKELREDFNVLHITYTWRFDSEGWLESRP